MIDLLEGITTQAQLDIDTVGSHIEMIDLLEGITTCLNKS